MRGAVPSCPWRVSSIEKIVELAKALSMVGGDPVLDPSGHGADVPQQGLVLARRPPVQPDPRRPELAENPERQDGQPRRAAPQVRRQVCERLVRPTEMQILGDQERGGLLVELGADAVARPSRRPVERGDGLQLVRGHLRTTSRYSSMQKKPFRHLPGSPG